MKRPVIPSRAPVRSPQALGRLGGQFHAALGRGDYVQALQCATQAWTLTRTPNTLSDVALCQMRLKQFQLSYDTYLRVLKQLQTANVYDGLTEVAGHLGKQDEVRRFGTRALQLKIEESARETPAATAPDLAAHPPRPFDPRDPSRNVIAFSLFGGDPRYCEMSVLNVRAAHELFPGWHCRFYVDASVPVGVQQRLRQEGAVVVDLQGTAAHALPATTWRFLALDDPGVDRAQFRDADSLVSTRDQAAVLAWCASECWFHVMRDYPSHTELILAGMWGACRGALANVGDDIRAYVGSRTFSQRFVDQHFLRHRVWQVTRQSLLMHDSQFDLPENQPFPPHAPMAVDARYAHVGANVGAPSMEVQHAAADGTRVQWTLQDASGAAVCSYGAVVQANAYRVSIPAPYASEIAAGRWNVITRPAD